MKWIKLFEGYLDQYYEDLNIQGTYLTRHSEEKENMRSVVGDMIGSIVEEKGISLPVPKWGKEFVEIKKSLYERIKSLNKHDFMEDYLNNNQVNTKHHRLDSILKEFLISFCCDEQTKNPIRLKPFDLKKVKFEFNLVSELPNEKIYQVVLPIDVKEYIIKNKDVNSLDHLIYMSCEPDNFNRIHFGGRMERKKIFKSHDKIAPKRNIMSYGTEYLGKSPSSYDLLNGLPSSIKGLGLGYLMYKQFIQHLGYASSSKGSSKESQMVWQKLTKDDNLTGLIINLIKKEGLSNMANTWGKILMFDKNFKGDFNKICRDFIEKSESGFEIVSLEVDDFLKSKVL
jgi:hypothetical protein